MNNKPSWRLWLILLLAYTLLDMIIEAVLHNGPAWNQLPGAFKDAALGATLTWFLALFRWYKAQDRF